MRVQQHPLVSIIMTTYNAEAHLKESLMSALKQDIKNLEVLCIDGHSKDGTISIINDFMRKDDRVKLVFQERPGIGAAKNCGIENARGEYITFLDADDFYVDHTALRKMYDACKREEVRVCGAFRSTLFLDGTVENELLHRNDCKAGMKSVRLQYRERPYDYHFHSYLYDREMIVDSDARFAEVKAYDDTHFFIRAMLQAKIFCVVPVELYRYRCGPAYDWGMDRANDAILALIDQLKLTKQYEMDTLHWLTVQRINYEYGGIFEKNVLAGDYALLEQLMQANREIDPEMIQRAEKNLPSEKWYLGPMMHRTYADMILRKTESPYAPTYIIEPLWKIMHPSGQDNSEQLREINRLQERIAELEQVAAIKKDVESIWLIRKIKGGIQCIKDHGFRYTMRHTCNKMIRFIQRGRKNG